MSDRYTSEWLNSLKRREEMRALNLPITWYFAKCGHSNVHNEYECQLCRFGLTLEDRAIIQRIAARRARRVWGMPRAIEVEEIDGWHKVRNETLKELRAVARPQCFQDDYDIMFTFLENNDPLTSQAARNRRAFIGITEENDNA